MLFFLAASPPRSVILDCCHISSIDYTVVVGLRELLQELHKHGLSLAFCSLQVCGKQPPCFVLLLLLAPGISSAHHSRVCTHGPSLAAFHMWHLP